MMKCRHFSFKNMEALWTQKNPNLYSITNELKKKKKELALKSHKTVWQMYKEYKKGQQITLGESYF